MQKEISNLVGKAFASANDGTSAGCGRGIVILEGGRDQNLSQDAKEALEALITQFYLMKNILHKLELREDKTPEENESNTPRTGPK